MSVSEILEQAKKLSPTERKELAKGVIDLLDTPLDVSSDAPEAHWGQNLIRLLDELGPIELIHPDIEDPVEWVKTMRREERQRRLGDWGEHEKRSEE